MFSYFRINKFCGNFVFPSNKLYVSGLLRYQQLVFLIKFHIFQFKCFYGFCFPIFIGKYHSVPYSAQIHLQNKNFHIAIQSMATATKYFSIQLYQSLKVSPCLLMTIIFISESLAKVIRPIPYCLIV